MQASFALCALKGRKFNRLLAKLAFLGAITALFVYGVHRAVRLPLPSPEAPFLLYSNQSRHDLELLYTSALQKAKHSILLQMYALTDPSILCVLAAQHAKGVSTQAFYDKGASVDLRNAPFEAYPLHCQGLMHRKIAIIDRSLVLIGSANMTPQSLHLHDNLVAGIYSPPLAEFLHLCSEKTFSFSLGQRQAELWLLADKTHEALERVIACIQGARKKIRVALFTLTHPALVEALIEAKKRGVDVACAVDFYTAKGASLRAIEKLRSSGIKIRISQGQKLLHHKWAEIDHHTLILGSANWTRAAFEKNHDCFIIVNNLSPQDKKFMRRLFKNYAVPHPVKK